ncbi:hypothetical protein V5096_15135 [Pseudoalteromonas carrageenovora]|uniref:methylation-associated defense system protein MAD7 n=1 Tax=Pseudoalteromonas carrageenovora TaxID=227 RepID=UPI002FD78AC5
MKLGKKDKAFRTNKVSYLDYKIVEMDRVLTHLFARLKHNGASSKLSAKGMTVDLFKDEFLDSRNEKHFKGFSQAPITVEKWIETHLVDLINRGKANEAVAAPRPLHGNTYLFRNPKNCRDYGASKQVYELLYHAKSGQAAITRLKTFFFAGVDSSTGQYDSQSQVDIETQALLRLSDQVKSDAPDHSDLQDRFAPLNQQAADTLAEDIIKLMTYRQYIPRSVMVEYIKNLLAFHLALYQLKLFKLLPSLAKSKGRNLDESEKQQTAIYVDMTNGANSLSHQMAEQSATLHYKRIPAFIKAYFGVKKLDEFAEYLSKKGKLSGSKSIKQMPVTELFKLLESPLEQDREQFFGQRNAGILDSSVSSANESEDIPPEIHAITQLGLPEYETYIEILLFVQGNAIRSGLVKNLDSFMLKNKPGALLEQNSGSHGGRRFCLDGRLLEVMLQLAVLSKGGDLGFHTRELRVDELLTFLKTRYGIHIDSLTDTDSFCDQSIDVNSALRDNLAGFKRRLREIGFYRDLSDAYVTQTVTPRYQIDQNQNEKAQGSRA